jgi:aspartate carbamoyltransferase catalytic subunit
VKTFTSIRSLGRSDLDALISDALELRARLDDGEIIPRSLQGRCVANMFFEPSTRTRLSFDLAAQRLGAHVMTFDPVRSSTSKGESLRDTSMTVAAIGADVLVVRHSQVGIPQSVSEWTGLPVINAGDGVSEHPTQALLDAVTLRRHVGDLSGLRMAVVGDIAHSRVAGSLVHAMPVLGVDLTLVGPSRWLPDESPIEVSESLDRVIEDVDVLYLLRVQTERGGVIDQDYITEFGVDAARAARMRDGALVMHAGPINRGVEISEQVAESPRSLINEQVRNGVPTRMAVLRALAGDTT